MIKKVLVAAIVMLAFSGCDYQSKEYLAFVKKYGADSRQFCSAEGFLTEDKMAGSNSVAATRTLIRDQDSHYVRCSVGGDGEILE